MPYQVRTDKTTMGPFDSEEDAVKCVRQLLKTNPDTEPEILDSSTGKPVAPAASKSWRDQLANEIGY